VRRRREELGARKREREREREREIERERKVILMKRNANGPWSHFAVESGESRGQTSKVESLAARGEAARSSGRAQGRADGGFS
jgi:hypothetical protein